ncbi:hypothetical protein [Marinifilum caeruleilacunae]|uniref:Uncharacterized protein n=1 Tax=Marinifilum caeruleilacunae TaxID=2499076 RepID=A0ABX1X0Q3_9BACT|nr:hypothetical protein [Marinifilum caeruleilacunae]NOU61991.1 hypothetical protein [Marinifilum caeruleilacunae]
MFIGYFDYIIFGLLLLFNVLYWKKRFNGKTGCLIIGILFGVAIPYVSMEIELLRVKSEFEMIDGFNLLYTIFRFPMYWIIGILQSILINIHDKQNQPEGNKS